MRSRSILTLNEERTKSQKRFGLVGVQQEHLQPRGYFSHDTGTGDPDPTNMSPRKFDTTDLPRASQVATGKLWTFLEPDNSQHPNWTLVLKDKAHVGNTRRSQLPDE